MRRYRTFGWKDSNFRICSTHFDVITREIVAQRECLERYICRHPAFLKAMTPVPLLADAPEIARRMQRAAARVGVGPMAAVAGVIAQLAAEAALRTGATEAIVENGGDIYAASTHETIVALHAGRAPVGAQLALVLRPQAMPVAVCSSSGTMGHSTSLGECDLATVVAADAALADAAATLAANLVHTVADIDAALNRVRRIRDVQGVLLVKGDRIGLAGTLPELVRHTDRQVGAKLTRDSRSAG